MKNNEDENMKECTFKIIDGRNLLRYKIKEFPYVIDRLIPENAITSISADSGKGKSIFMLILMKHIALGEKLFDDFKVQQKTVLIIDQEMDKDTIASRFQSIIETELAIDFLLEQHWSINHDESYKWLKQKIIEKGYGLIVFDTFTHIHTGDENKAGDMKEVNRRMLELIRDTGVTIIYLHHHRKLQRGEKLSQAVSRGSTDLIAKVSSHLLLDSVIAKGDDEYILKLTVQQAKSRRPDRIDKISLEIIYNQKTQKTTYKYLGDLKAESAIEQAKRLILKVLSDGGEYSITDLRKNIATVGENNIRDACKELRISKKIQAERKGRKDIFFLK